jgi:hypothetical protein
LVDHGRQDTTNFWGGAGCPDAIQRKTTSKKKRKKHIVVSRCQRKTAKGRCAIMWDRKRQGLLAGYKGRKHENMSAHDLSREEKSKKKKK